MLSKAERYQVLSYIRYVSMLAPFPVEVDLKSWDVRPGPGVKSFWKKLACCITFGLFCAHASVKSLTLVYGFVYFRDDLLHQLSVHIAMASSGTIVVWWYYILFYKYPEVYGCFARITLVANISGGISPLLLLEEPRRRKLVERMVQRSGQDLVAIWCPYMIGGAQALIFLAHMYDPTLSVFLYSWLPASYQTWLWLCVCFMEEVRWLNFYASVLIPIWQLQVISFDLVTKNLERMVEAPMRRDSNVLVKAERTYESLRHLQLYMKMLNILNQDLIFTWKLVSITAAIAGGYAAIAHMREYPLFGAMYYVILMDCTLMYTLVYGAAFKIPTKFKQAVTETLLRIGCARNWRNAPGRKKMLERQFKSVPCMGIQVGSFHTMERTSTPVFVDFVLRNIVNLLVPQMILRNHSSIEFSAPEDSFLEDDDDPPVFISV